MKTTMIGARLTSDEIRRLDRLAKRAGLSRSAALRSSQELIVAANRELRDELAQEKERRAQLEGRLDVLMSGLAERIIAAVADTWHRAYESAAGGTNGG